MQHDRFFYGWVIVAFTFALQFVAVGLSYYAFSVFLKPFTEMLGADFADVSLSMSIQSVVIGVMGPLAAKWYGRYPLKLLLSLGVACLAGGYLLLPHITEVWHLWLIWGGLIGMGSVMVGFIPCNLMLANWFAAERGRAMGISQAGITISGTTLVPLLTFISLNFGLELTFTGAAIAAVAVLLPLIYFLAVLTPEQRGLHPDGATSPPPSVETSELPKHWTFSNIVRNRDVWLVTLTVGPCYLGIGAVIINMPSHITELGLSAMQASWVVLVTTLFGACAKPLFGTLSDYFNKKGTTALAITCQIVGVMTLLYAQSYGLLMVAGAFFGLGYGAMAPLWGILLSTRFGREGFAQVMGASQPLLIPFNLVGIPAANYVYDMTGSYLPAFAALLGGYAVALIAVSLIKLPAKV